MADPRGEPTKYDQHFVPAIDFKTTGRALRHRARRRMRFIRARRGRNCAPWSKAFRPDVAHVRNIYHHLSPSILWELKAQGFPWFIT